MTILTTEWRATSAAVERTSASVPRLRKRRRRWYDHRGEVRRYRERFAAQLSAGCVVGKFVHSVRWKVPTSRKSGEKWGTPRHRERFAGESGHRDGGVPSGRVRRDSDGRDGAHCGASLGDGEWSSHEPAADSGGRT